MELVLETGPLMQHTKKQIMGKKNGRVAKIIAKQGDKIVNKETQNPSQQRTKAPRLVLDSEMLVITRYL
jgi:hypothetical protein